MRRRGLAGDVGPPTSTVALMTEEDIDGVGRYLNVLPLPAYKTPRGPGCLASVPDSAFKAAPPHVVVHIQRTASQGGLQVISPRQTPLSCMLTRVSGGEKQLGDHIVGSIADPGITWPTIDGDDLSHLLPDEPLPVRMADPTMVSKTRTEPLTRASALLADPILACLVKGRAVIDILARDDVAGGWREVARILASAWGIPVADLMDLDAFTLGYDGPLLRHAIKADEVFPITHAPIHVRRCVSVGTNEATRANIQVDTALDWRRMRVLAEAVYLMSCCNEGLPVRYMAAHPAPGDPNAPLGRPNTLAFRIAPCTAWSFDSRSFSICPVNELPPIHTGAIPAEVLEALARYVSVVRPMSYVMARGHKPSTKGTRVEEVEPPPEETITESFRIVLKGITTGSGRGRLAVSTLRNVVYETLESMTVFDHARFARFVHIARSECMIHLGTHEVPDEMIDKLAHKFLSVGDMVRSKLAHEAVRRGKTIEQWWVDATAQTPTRFNMFKEGSLGWARIAMWMTFKEVSDKWAKLGKAIHFSALRRAGVQELGGMALPAERGSPERLLEACRIATRKITTAYMGYYIGVSDVGLAMADHLMSRGKERSANLVREAAHLWVLRGRAFRGTNVEALACGSMERSANHLRVRTLPMDVVVVPAPYVAYMGYRGHAIKSPVVPSQIRAMLPRDPGGRVSQVFKNIKRPIAAAPESLLTRYLLDPARLGADMEAAWAELAGDLREVAAAYGAQEVGRCVIARTELETVVPSLSFDMADLMASQAPTRYDPMEGTPYWELVGHMDRDEYDWMEDQLLEMPEDMMLEIQDGSYTDIASLLAVVTSHLRDEAAAGGAAFETVG